MIIRWAKVTTQFEGLHRYPDAEDSVAYLRNLHRHIFHVTVWVEQFHNERDVEYLTLLHWLRRRYNGFAWTETASCETIANILGQYVMREYPDRKVKVEVTEDGENGALVEMS